MCVTTLQILLNIPILRITGINTYKKSNGRCSISSCYCLVIAGASDELPGDTRSWWALLNNLLWRDSTTVFARLSIALSAFDLPTKCGAASSYSYRCLIELYHEFTRSSDQQRGWSIEDRFTVETLKLLPRIVSPITKPVLRRTKCWKKSVYSWWYIIYLFLLCIIMWMCLNTLLCQTYAVCGIYN